MHSEFQTWDNSVSYFQMRFSQEKLSATILWLSRGRDIKSIHSRFTWESRVKIHSVFGLIKRGDCDATFQERKQPSVVEQSSCPVLYSETVCSNIVDTYLFCYWICRGFSVRWFVRVKKEHGIYLCVIRILFIAVAELLDDLYGYIKQHLFRIYIQYISVSR